MNNKSIISSSLHSSCQFRFSLEKTFSTENYLLTCHLITLELSNGMNAIKIRRKSKASVIGLWISRWWQKLFAMKHHFDLINIKTSQLDLPALDKISYLCKNLIWYEQRNGCFSRKCSNSIPFVYSRSFAFDFEWENAFCECLVQKSEIASQIVIDGRFGVFFQIELQLKTIKMHSLSNFSNAIYFLLWFIHWYISQEKKKLLHQISNNDDLVQTMDKKWKSTNGVFRCVTNSLIKILLPRSQRQFDWYSNAVCSLNSFAYLPSVKTAIASLISVLE